MDSAALFVPLQDTDTRKLPSEACSAVLLLRTLPPPRFQEGLVAVARNNKESGSSWDWSAVGAFGNSALRASPALEQLDTVTGVLLRIRFRLPADFSILLAVLGKVMLHVPYRPR